MNVTKSQTHFLSSLGHLDLPKNKDLPTEFPRAPTPPTFDAITTLVDSLEAAVKSPIPRLHHWLLRRLSSMRSAKAYKDRAIAEGLQAAKKRMSKDEEKTGSITSAIDHLVHREIALARKEGREPEYAVLLLRPLLLSALLEELAAQLDCN